MQHALFLAPFDELSEPAVLVDLARRAEAGGWDGVFLWDHTVYRDPVEAVADPWVAMAAMAAATSRIRIGPLVTPPARRRPWKLARETVTLDRLSGGRVTLGLGLGGDSARELSGFGEEIHDRTRAAMLEESLDLLERCFSGEPISFEGEHYTVESKPFLPLAVQRPRPPIWLASRGSARKPMRRAALYDGWFPIELDGPEQLRAGVEEIAAIRREAGLDAPFDVAVTTDERGQDPAPWKAAGATWWLEGLDYTPTLAAAEELLAKGPPAKG